MTDVPIAQLPNESRTERLFPSILPRREVGSAADDPDDSQSSDTPESIKRLWQEKIVDAKEIHLNSSIAEARQILYFGAVELRAKTLDLTDLRIFGRCQRWVLLLQKLWEASKDMDDLRLLQGSWNDLLHHGPQSGDIRHNFLLTAAQSYQVIYESRRSDHNFNLARLLARMVLNEAKPGRQQVEAYKRLGRLYSSRMGQLQTSDSQWRVMANTCVHNFNLGIAKLEESNAERTPSDNDMWVLASWALARRYEKAYQDEDIMKAISYLKHIMGREQEGSDLWLKWADQLARAHWQRYDETFQIQDALDGGAVFEKILGYSPDNPHACSGLAELLRKICKHKILSNAARRESSSRAIDLLERCVAITDEDDPMLASRLGKLSEALSDRFTYDAIVDDIDVAIALQLTALELPLLPESAKWFHYQQLCAKYILRFNHMREKDDIDAALDAGLKCVELSGGRDSKERADARLQLAAARATLFHQSSQRLEDLEQALLEMKEAEQLFTQSNWRPVGCLQDLALLLCIRFQRLSDYEDAASGIKYIREAINIHRGLSGKAKDAREASCLDTLGKLMLARFRTFGAEEDLNEAIRAYQDALKSTDTEHKEYTPRASDLTYALTVRYEMLGGASDMRQADDIIEVALQALASRKGPSTNSEVALLENQRGILKLRRWARETDGDQVAREALGHFRRASAKDPKSLPYSSNVASTLGFIALHTHDVNDCIAALKDYAFYIQTIKTQSPQNLSSLEPDIYDFIAKMAMSQMIKNSDNLKWRSIAAERLSALSELPMAKPSVRLWAAAERATIAFSREQDYETASKYITLAVTILPGVLTPGLSRTDQLRLIKEYVNLPVFALTFSITAGHDASDGLQLFEQTRGTLWNRMLRENDDLEALEEVDRNLAKEFKELHDRLALPRRPIASLESDSQMAFKMFDCYQDAGQYNALLGKIRALPGLRGFLLLPAKAESLSSFAADGCIAVVNCASQYAHAVLVTRGQVTVLKLTYFSETRAKDLYQKMKDMLTLLKEKKEEQARDVFNGVCLDLWQSIAKPVLDKVDELLPGHNEQESSRKPPRIWWLANRWMNVLPIHVAGDYTSEAKGSNVSTVLDRSVSSYIPSFGALNFARKKAATKRLLNQENEKDKPSSASALIMSMPTTPKQAPLPFAKTEASAVSSILQRANSHITITALTSASATKKSITAALKTCTIAHFICHGQIDPHDPLRSQLLHIDSYKTPLDVRTLIRTPLTNCQLAYVSVCSSAASGEEALPLIDEGLHAAGAFLMAGVPHVVGTRWEIMDEPAVKMADNFYSGLKREDGLEGGGGEEESRSTRNSLRAGVGLDLARSAEALRNAMLIAREEGVSPLLWGAYVHFGA